MPKTGWATFPNHSPGTGWKGPKLKLPRSKKKVLAVLALLIFGLLVVDQVAKLVVFTNASSCIPTPAEVEWHLRCGDPSTFLWQATAPNADLSEFNTVNVAYTTNTHDGNLNKVLSMNPTSTQSAVALTKGTIDLSSISAKQLWNQFDWGAVNGPGSCCGSFQPWGMYLTTNGTAPQGSQYNPENDPSVGLIMRTYSSGGGAAGMFTMHLFFQRKQAETIASEQSAGNTCSPATSCFQTITFFRDPTAHWIAPEYFLNFTSRTTGGSCSGVQGDGCSSLEEGLSVNFATSQVLPWFNFQGTPYYVGFYQLFNEPMHIQWAFDTATIPTVCGQGCNEFILYQPDPTSVIASPNIDTGGFFGPVIRALLSLGAFIAASLFVFIAFIAQNIVTGLNSMGNFFGWGNIGTTAQSVINAIVNLITNSFASFINTLVSRAEDVFTLVTTYFTTWTAGILEWITELLVSIGFIATLTLKLFLYGGTFYLLFDGVWFFLEVGDSGIDGFGKWIAWNKWAVFAPFNLLERFINFIINGIMFLVSIAPTLGSKVNLPNFPIIDAPFPGFHVPNPGMKSLRQGNPVSVVLFVCGLAFFLFYLGSSISPLSGAAVASGCIPRACINTALNSVLLPFMGLLFVGFGVMVISYMANSFSGALDEGPTFGSFTVIRPKTVRRIEKDVAAPGKAGTKFAKNVINFFEKQEKQRKAIEVMRMRNLKQAPVERK